jgi:uncharacterized protein
MMTQTRSARQIVENTYAALLERGDMDEFMADFADDAELIEVESLPYGGRFRGKAAIKGAMLNLLTYWSDLSYVIERIVDSTDCVIAQGTFAAKGAKSGIAVSFPLAEVWTVKDGQITELLAIYGDTKQVVDALA